GQESNELRVIAIRQDVVNIGRSKAPKEQTLGAEFSRFFRSAREARRYRAATASRLSRPTFSTASKSGTVVSEGVAGPSNAGMTSFAKRRSEARIFSCGIPCSQFTVNDIRSTP